MNLKLRLKLLCIALGIVLAAGMSGCKSAQTVSPSDEYSPEATNAKPAAKFKALADSYKSWNDITVPVKVVLREPKSISLSGTLRMIKGKSLNISMRFLGMEVATFYADNDSLIASVKMAQSYISEPMSILRDNFGLDLKDLQAMLLGQAFMPGKGVVLASDASLFDISDKGKTLLLQPKEWTKKFPWSFSATNEAIPVLKSFDVDAAKYGSLSANFADVVSSVAGMMATDVSVEATIGKNKLDASLYYSAERAEFNTKTVITRPVLNRNMRRIDTARALKILKSL